MIWFGLVVMMCMIFVRRRVLFMLWVMKRMVECWVF